MISLIRAVSYGNVKMFVAAQAINSLETVASFLYISDVVGQVQKALMFS